MLPLHTVGLHLFTQHFFLCCIQMVGKRLILDAAAIERDLQLIADLLEACPEDRFHFMTPFGYVDLNAQDAERLRQGAAAQAHTGESGWEIPVPAEKLLQQELVSARKAENGQWYAITTDPQPKMSESEQMQEMQL